MTDEDRAASNLTNAVVGLVFIFLVFMNIALALSINGNWFGRKISTKPPDLLPADYFDVLEPWGETTFINDDTGLLSDSELDLSTCTWFTYQNALNIDKTPSLQDAITDYRNGFSHLTPPQPCISSDQIVFKRARRVCDGPGVAECIGVNGLNFRKNEIETFNYSCAKNIPICDGSIGSLSFNFLKNNRGKFDLVDSKTRVMTIEKIYVSSSRLAQLDDNPENHFYTRQGQLFATSSVYNELNDDQYYPIITYQGKKTNSFKQTILLKRYIFDGSYVPDSSGPYGEIIFRPANLYLDIEINNQKNQIDQFSPDKNVEAYSQLYREQFRIRRMYRENDDTPLETTCTGYIVGNDAYVSIYKKGNEIFTIGEKIRILGDDDTTKSLTITVDTLSDFSIFFVFKPIMENTSPRKWLLIPPLDIGGGKVIPRRDRSSYMRVFNGYPFSKDLYELSKSRPAPGAERYNGDSGLEKAYRGRNPLAEYSDGLYSGYSSNPVLPKTKVLNRRILNNRPQTDEDIVPDVQGEVVWWEILETFVSRNTTTKKLITPIKYDPSDYPNNSTEDYLVSVGQKSGFVDQTSSPFYTIEPYLAWKLESSGTPGLRRYRYKAMMTMFKIDGSPNIETGNRYLDGTVIWELVNSAQEIVVPSSTYFFKSSTSGGQISNFIETGESSNQKYKKDIRGTLFQLVVVGYELDGSDIDTVAISSFSGSFSGLEVTGGNNDGVVTLHFINGRLTSTTIETGGTGYEPGETVSVTIPATPSLTLEAVRVVNLIADSDNILYNYIAVPQDQESNNLFNIGVSNSDLAIKNGFVLFSDQVSISDSGQLTLNSSPENCILRGGSGYTIDLEDQSKNIVYIDQVDQFGKSTIKNENRVPSSFFSIQITELNKDVVAIKTKPLMDPSLETTLPNYIEYNFYENPDHKRVYGKSPQQIGYIDDPSITDYIRSGNEAEFGNYLSRNAQRPFNSIVGINTLQFERLEYTTSTTAPSIPARDNLVLGKFIPYTTYYSENPVYIEDDEQVRRNYNYTQFIPNSISGLYTRPVDENILPDF